MFNLDDRVRILSSYDDHFVGVTGVVNDITPCYDEIYNEEEDTYDDGDLIGYDCHILFDVPIQSQWDEMTPGMWFSDEAIELLEKPPRKKLGFALFVQEKGL